MNDLLTSILTRLFMNTRLVDANLIGFKLCEFTGDKFHTSDVIKKDDNHVIIKIQSEQTTQYVHLIGKNGTTRQIYTTDSI